MKNLFILMSLIFFCHIAKAQSKEARKAERAHKRELQLIEDQKKAELVEFMLHSRHFLLNTEYLSDRYGNRIFASSDICFIKVDSSSAIVQWGFPTGLGANGLGGLTIDGEITKYDLSKHEKNNSYSLRMNLQSHTGSFQVVFSISSDGVTTATVTGATVSGSISFTGNLTMPEVSRVFKGTSF